MSKPIIITISNYNDQEIDYLIQADAAVSILKESTEEGKITDLTINVNSLGNPKGIIEVKGR